MTVHQVFMLLAVVCFFIAATGIPTRQINTLALGLFFWALDILIAGGR